MATRFERQKAPEEEAFELMAAELYRLGWIDALPTGIEHKEDSDFIRALVEKLRTIAKLAPTYDDLKTAQYYPDHAWLHLDPWQLALVETKDERAVGTGFSLSMPMLCGYIS